MSKKVKIISYTNDKTRIYIPDLRVNRLFEKYGQSYLFEVSTIEEMLYYPSVRKLFETGLFYIDDKDLRGKFGLEEDNGEVTETVTAPISDTIILSYLKAKTFKEFKNFIDNLPIEQQKRFVDIAVKNKFIDYEKVNYIKELTGMDIINIIKINED